MSRLEFFTVFAAVLLPCIAGSAWAQPTLKWADLHDGGAHMAETGTAALTDSQGNLVVAGESTGDQGVVSILVRKLDRDAGLPIWSRQYTPPGGTSAIPTCMVWDGHGNIIVAGFIKNCLG